ncbi:MAG: dTDP-4-dehydrorhamnose 3,5-epimerase [Patescibacteria group bacterium]|jgi:dTDP-4-dehydrorhamnose 3,5-epimerase
MNFKKLKISGLILVEPDVFGDERGFFLESYHQKKFTEEGIRVNFVQDNHSRSSRGVLRGLHFQKAPFAQDKLVRVVRGEVFDVAVDLRPDSPTLGQWEAVVLSEKNKKIFFIPQGFAHGFLALSEVVDFEYKVSNFYSPESEMGIIFDDPRINISWPLVKEELILSAKDKGWPLFSQVKDELKKIWGKQK